MSDPTLLPRETPEDWIAKAKEAHDPIQTFCLFSGGSDSLVLAHRCRDHYDELVHIDTGTAVPGVLDHVRKCADELGKPLRVMRHDFDAYALMVVGGTDPSGKTWEPLGFPGPAQHGRAYTRLKERMLEKLLRQVKEGHPRTARVLALSGVRRAESARRATRYPITRRGSMVFCNPLIEWSNKEMADYRDQYNLRLSDVAALLHRSGECNCGCYADQEEREMLQSLWPEWFEKRIGSLERRAEAAGVRFCKWGEARGELATGNAGELCSSCDAMADRKQLIIEGVE
jgi:3'-phosphoadenosine 5'-phosphosulfate sulfotransferase (PAPS reductase)/FAD synthetase